MTRVKKNSADSPKVKDQSSRSSGSVQKPKLKKHMQHMSLLTNNTKTKKTVGSKKVTLGSKKVRQGLVVERKIEMGETVSAENLGDGSCPKRQNVPCQNVVFKLYIRFKKPIKDMVKSTHDLMELHPDIQNIRLPRRGEKSKFFHAGFKSEKKAFSAMAELKKTNDIFVRPAFGKESEKKVIEEKLPKQILRKLWG